MFVGVSVNPNHHLSVGRWMLFAPLFHSPAAIFLFLGNEKLECGRGVKYGLPCLVTGIIQLLELTPVNVTSLFIKAFRLRFLWLLVFNRGSLKYYVTCCGLFLYECVLLKGTFSRKPKT